ncbi:MAG TPA: hypothetical protein VF573_14680 [Paraburkholderia sp.]|uniref:hypothetical protein n=1 Tax=Paraburkholderia sp. TaxID=1926495 RepID=UPI002ED250A8
MADIIKQFLSVAEAKRQAKIFQDATKAMAEHCDKRIATASKAINREEKYLNKLLRSKTAGGVMAGDIEGAFHRLRSALEAPLTPSRHSSTNRGSAA